MSNWLFERCAFTVGRIVISPGGNLAMDSGVNEMIQVYDAITAFTWSDDVRPTVSPRDCVYTISYDVVPSCQILQLIPLCWVSETSCSKYMRESTVRLRQLNFRSQCPWRISNTFPLDFLQCCTLYKALATVKN